MAERDPNEIGALWTKQGPRGTYMTGTVLGQRVVIFSLQKRGEKSPDWRVLKSIPKAQAPAEDEAPW